MQKMKANVFHGPNNIRVEEVPRPHAGAGEAVIWITRSDATAHAQFQTRPNRRSI